MKVRLEVILLFIFLFIIGSCIICKALGMHRIEGIANKTTTTNTKGTRPPPANNAKGKNNKKR